MTFQASAVVTGNVIAAQDINDLRTDIQTNIFETANTWSAAQTFSDMFVANGQGVVIGHSAQETFLGGVFETQILGTAGADAGLAIGRYSADSDGAFLVLAKSRGATIGTDTIVQDGDILGFITFAANDGVDFISRAAEIYGAIDGTPGANDTPGRLMFLLAPDGSQVAVEKWRMTSVGVLTSVAGTPANAATTDGAILATGGISFTDVANAWIDDATHGTGTTSIFIGNETIDTTASDARLKENIVPVNGTARKHIDLLAPLLSEYDYKNGDGHFVGLLAQDVKEVLPQYVTGNEDQYSLKYHYMVPLALWGVSDLQKRVAELEGKMG
jgi:hypothetical protein